MTATPEARSARDQILASDDLTRKPIDLSKWWPDLDQQLYVRSMPAADRSRFEVEMDIDPAGKARNSVDIQTKLVVRVLVDGDGNRIFKDGDLELVGRKHSQAIQAIFELGAELNALTPDSIKKLEKNSGDPMTDS